MTVYITLLRGINVSGHNLIKMADLRRMCEEMGLVQVQTYIQSGNLLFESQEEEEELRRRIEQEIQAAFGLSVPVALRSAAELKRILANCPFPADHLAEGESLYVSLLAEAPAPEAIDHLLSYRDEVDEYAMVGREIYILARQSYHKSRLTNQFFEHRLRVPATSRNWRTITKLAAMAAERDPSDQ